MMANVNAVYGLSLVTRNVGDDPAYDALVARADHKERCGCALRLEHDECGVNGLVAMCRIHETILTNETREAALLKFENHFFGIADYLVGQGV